MKSLYFLVLLLSISLIADVDAGWKFWKKKKDDNSTSTETPVISSPESVTPGSTTKASTTTVPTAKAPTSKVPVNTKQALAGAADPGLVIGAGNTGGNIRDNARPQRPNPGTEVGFDFPNPKPTTKPGSNGYRDFAIDLTGAGEGRKPDLPGQQTRPGSPATGQQPTPGIQTPRPGTPAQTPKPGTPVQNPVQTPRPGTPAPTPKPGTPVQTPKPTTPGHQTPASGPGSLGYPSQPSRPGTPISAGTPNSGGKTFAQAASGGSKPGSPTPAPIGGVQPPKGSQPGNIQPTSQPGKSGISTGAAAGAAVGAAADAAGQKYSSNPTFSKGDTITNEDLEKLAEALFIKDSNNAMKYITLNIQKQTTGSSPVDEAPQPLLNVGSDAQKIPTIEKVHTIYDNYQLDSTINEYISPLQRNEESLLVDTFLSTNVMAFAMRFLANKGLVTKDYYKYKDLLRKIWFDLYSRGEGKIGSSGFEHVFMAELNTGTRVSGLHNWIYFNKEEASKKANYLGYIKKVDLGNKAAILKFHAKFRNLDKPVTSMFIGTSPELEMALYTVCFLVKPDKPCPVSLGGTKFNISTHTFKYRGKHLIGSAYPDI